MISKNKYNLITVMLSFSIFAVSIIEAIFGFNTETSKFNNFFGIFVSGFCLGIMFLDSYVFLENYDINKKSKIHSSKLKTIVALQFLIVAESIITAIMYALNKSWSYFGFMTGTFVICLAIFIYGICILVKGNKIEKEEKQPEEKVENKE